MRSGREGGRGMMAMDRLTHEIRHESPWTIVFADDTVICSECGKQVEGNLERWRHEGGARGEDAVLNT